MSSVHTCLFPVFLFFSRDSGSFLRFVVHLIDCRKKLDACDLFGSLDPRTLATESVAFPTVLWFA